MIEKSRKYKRIGERIIASDPDMQEIRDYEVRIAFLSSDREKKQNHKIVYADCGKVEDKYKWTCPYDFMITVYEPNCIGFNAKQFNILLKHELLHVGIDSDGEDISFYVVPHDVEEFWPIINEFGLDWDKKEE